jgi:general secretion pathway protein E
LLANMAQRLVRRLCPACKQAFVPRDEELREIGLTRQQLDAKGGHLFRPAGCEACLNTGYRGRMGIYELLEVTDEVRALVMQRADAGAIKKVAVSQGMRSLRGDGGDKVLQGLTSIEEVLRVTHEEGR